MSTEQQEQAPPAPEETPPGTGVELTPEQQAVLSEHGIEVPEDGKISVADHVKLLESLSRARRDQREAEQQKEQARLAALSEADRKLEEAKAAGRAEAEAELKKELIKAQVKAEATAKGFVDPGDAFTMIPDLSSIDAEEGVRAAVERLAAEKPYLIKKSGPSLETGPQGSKETGGNANDWLRKELTR